ncbi:MAG: hypothetical protein Q4D32_05235, partial [Eubacteriales bacterium]|nr:hypothetical protein [Eubacteriales bacterium]
MKKIRKIYQGVSIALVLALVVNLCGCSSVSKTQKTKESDGQPVTEDNSSTVIEKTDADLFAVELQ